jgi:hypothetical protein
MLKYHDARNALKAINKQETRQSASPVYFGEELSALNS